MESILLKTTYVTVLLLQQPRPCAVPPYNSNLASELVTFFLPTIPMLNFTATLACVPHFTQRPPVVREKKLFSISFDSRFTLKDDANGNIARCLRPCARDVA